METSDGAIVWPPQNVAEQRLFLRRTWPKCGEFPHRLRDGVTCENQESFAQRYITSGFLFYIFMFLVGFEMIGLAWIVVLWTFNLNSSLVSSEFGVVFFMLTFFAANQYAHLITRYSDGYASTQGNFLVLGQSVVDLATHFFCTTLSNLGGAANARLYKQCRNILAAMCVEIYRVFDTTLHFDETQRILDDNELLQELKASRAFDYPAETFRTLHAMFMRRVALLARNTTLSNNYFFNDIARYNQRIEDAIERAGVGVAASPPSVYTNMAYLVITLYLVFFAPPYLILSVHPVLFLTMYPFILLIGYMPSISYRWVGGAFSNTNHVPTLDYHRIISHWIEIIVTRYERGMVVLE